MDDVVDQKGSDHDSNIFRSFILKQIASSIPQKERVGSLSSEMVVGGVHVRDGVHLSSLQPWFYKREKHQSGGLSTNVKERLFDKYDHDFNAFMYFSHMDSSPSCVSLSDQHSRSRSYLRSRRSQRLSDKPVSSVQNCLIPQLYANHFKFEEYIFCVNTPSNVPNGMPYVTTNGNSVISKPNTKPLSVPCDSELDVKVDVVRTGLMEPVIESKELKCSSKKLQQGESGTSDIMDLEFISTSQDTSNHMLFYCLGVTIGAMLTIKSNKRELDDLNNLMKHSENFVQDLQDELKLKKSLTVIDLSNESYEKQSSYSRSSNIVEVVNSVLNEHSASDFPEVPHINCLPKAVESLEAMSKIEEELKAELELLELNMNASSLDRKMSELCREFDSKVDGDINADILRLSTLYNPVTVSTSKKNISTTQTYDAKDPVSPRELSLHLHEANQYRLEERIKKLESALEENVKKLHLLE